MNIDLTEDELRILIAFHAEMIQNLCGVNKDHSSIRKRIIRMNDFAVMLIKDEK